MHIFESEFFKNSKFHWDFLKRFQNYEEWEILTNQFKEKDLNKLDKEKIPKIIHQIWIGPKNLPNKYKKWMKSWLKFNPEYEYMLWKDRDIEKLKMINNKKYKESKNPGIKSDIARYEILYKFGGIYIDTDFECLAPIPNSLLKYDFVSSIIFDYKPCIANGFMMSKSESEILNKIIKNLNPVKKKLNINEIINQIGPGLLTREYFNLREKTRRKCLILPSDYFYPYPNFLLNSNYKSKQFIEIKSIGFHHWQMSWMKGNFLDRLYKKLIYLLVNIKNNIIKN